MNFTNGANREYRRHITKTTGIKTPMQLWGCAHSSLKRDLDDRDGECTCYKSMCTRKCKFFRVIWTSLPNDIHLHTHHIIQNNPYSNMIAKKCCWKLAWIAWEKLKYFILSAANSHDYLTCLRKCNSIVYRIPYFRWCTRHYNQKNYHFDNKNIIK